MVAGKYLVYMSIHIYMYYEIIHTNIVSYVGYLQTNVRRENLGHSRLCCANRNTYDTHNCVNIVIKYLTQMYNLIKVDCNT